MYTDKNYRTKKALIEDVKAGKQVRVYQPNSDMTGQPDKTDGRITIEGPHYPEPHRWYATAVIEDGVIVKVS